MKYFLVTFLIGILCQNTLARGLDNPVLNDFERRLVRLETRQFSESENLEHRMLKLETKLGTQGVEKLEGNQLERNFYEISEKENPDEGMSFLQRLEKVEKNWEKELEEQLAKFSSKYENLSERFSAIEKELEEQKTSALDQVMETLSTASEEESRSTPPEESKSDNSEQDKFVDIGEKSYYIENKERTSWIGALQKCREMDAHLVSLQDEDEWSALKEALAEDNSYWTDINDRSVEDEFISETTSRIAPFLMWDDGEPNSAPGAEDCVELRAEHGYKMNDVDCYDVKYYICEKNN